MSVSASNSANKLVIRAIAIYPRQSYSRIHLNTCSIEGSLSRRGTQFEMEEVRDMKSEPSE